jgi:hypothetical protein
MVIQLRNRVILMGKLESPSLRAVQRVPSIQEQSISIDTHDEPLLNDHFGFVLEIRIS